MTDSNGRFLTAIFCDDIRYEKGDKESYMGCYLQENLFVSSVPVGLSRFCVHAIAYTPTKNPFRSLTFLVVQDSNQEIARLQIPENALNSQENRTDETTQRTTVRASFFFAPLMIEGPMLLQVVADTKDEILSGPQLFFRIDPDRVPDELKPSPPFQTP